MKALTLDEVCDLILAAERPTILSHVRPDGDTVGSAAALARLLLLLGKRPAWRCAGPCPARLAFLFQGIPFADPAENAGGTVFAVDVASPSQLGSLAGEYEGGRVSCMIDHHAVGVPFAPHYIRPEASATGELILAIAERLVSRGALPALTADLATAAYAAISSDTGCFRFANTTPLTHRCAARLLELGADAGEVNRLLFESRSEGDLRAEAIATENLVRTGDGRIAAVLLSRAARAGLHEENFELVIDVPRALAGVEIAATVREIEDGVCKLSLRSRGADVSAVARRFGGGGHIRAAGCTVPGTPAAAWEAVLPYLIAALAPQA